MSKTVKFFAGNISGHLAKEIANAYGVSLNEHKLISFSDGEFEPSFEETRLFKRSLGDSSDVVEKEMFSVVRRGENVDEKLKEGFTFRPEGTASAARAYIQGGFHANNPIQKWFYVGPMFRYERPQKGRLRQFHQFGVEAIGSINPEQDAEIISMAYNIYKMFGIDNLNIKINSLGSGNIRKQYGDDLKLTLMDFNSEFSELEKEAIIGPQGKFSDIFSDGVLQILSSNSVPKYQVNFKNLWPYTLSTIDFDATDTDIEYFTADVSFKYTIYRITDLENKNLT